MIISVKKGMWLRERALYAFCFKEIANIKSGQTQKVVPLLCNKFCYLLKTLAMIDSKVYYGMVSFLRTKTKKERCHLVEKQINFEIAALFYCLYRRVKKRGKFKANLSINQMESFFYCFNSRNIATYFFSKYFTSDFN